MTRTRNAHGPHPHPLTPAGLPPGDSWWNGCPDCHTPIQGGTAGLTAHRRVFHRPDPDDRRPTITIET